MRSVPIRATGASWCRKQTPPGTASRRAHLPKATTAAASISTGPRSRSPRAISTEATAMKFGLHQSSWLDTPDPAEAFEAVKAKAQWAEAHGFAWFSVLDHMIQIARSGPPDEPVMEGWIALAGLAAVTGRIRLATLATAVSYRNPAHLAKIAASVDLISQGRLTLGIGAGFFEDEYKQYGWEFPPRPATRIRQMEEALQLILKMWTEPRTTFHGEYFHVEDAILEPKPVQRPHPPVMIAGGGEQMTLRAVAQLADACNLVRGDIAEARKKLAVLRRHCDAAGRDYDTIEKTHAQRWVLARDDVRVSARRKQLAAQGPL